MKNNVIHNANCENIVWLGCSCVKFQSTLHLWDDFGHLVNEITDKNVWWSQWWSYAFKHNIFLMPHRKMNEDSFSQIFFISQFLRSFAQNFHHYYIHDCVVSAFGKVMKNWPEAEEAGGSWRLVFTHIFLLVPFKGWEVKRVKTRGHQFRAWKARRQAGVHLSCGQVFSLSKLH